MGKSSSSATVHFLRKLQPAISVLPPTCDGRPHHRWRASAAVTTQAMHRSVAAALLAIGCSGDPSNPSSETPDPSSNEPLATTGSDATPSSSPSQGEDGDTSGSSTQSPNGESTCGNGVVDEAEVCDDGNTNSCEGNCLGDCSAEVTITGCGDGVVCGTEACDDRNAGLSQGCAADCSVNTLCPNGILDDSYSGWLLALSGCREITGSLFIDDALTSLEGLQSLEVIGNDFKLEGTALTRISGVSKLKRVGGGLRIEANEMLVDLSGFSSLESVGRLYVQANNLLQDLHGLEGVTTLDEDLVIEYSEGLTSLHGLEGIAEVPGKVELRGLDSLEALTGFDGLKRVGGSFSVIRASSLESLAALSQLEDVGGSLSFGNGLESDGVPKIADTSPLQNLRRVGGTLGFHYTGITTLDPLSGLTALGGLDVSYNEDLTTLGAIAAQVTEVPGNIDFFSNSITAISGFDSLTTIGGSLQLYNGGIVEQFTAWPQLKMVCAAQGANGEYLNATLGCLAVDAWLPDFGGFSNLELVGGDVKIKVSELDLSPFDNLKTVIGSLVLTDTDLTELAGFASLVEVGGTLSLDTSQGVTQISGFTNLANLGGLSIATYFRLTDITGLTALRTLSGELRLYNNDELTTLAGLSQITHITGDINVMDNSALLPCLADDFVAALTEFGGTATITGNAPSGDCL